MAATDNIIFARERIFEMLKDTAKILTKGTIISGNVNDYVSDGMGGLKKSGTATGSGTSDFVKGSTQYKCRVTVPRAQARETETENNDLFQSHSDAEITFEWNVDLKKTWQIEVTSEEGKITVYEIQSEFDHSEPISQRYSCKLVL